MGETYINKDLTFAKCIIKLNKGKQRKTIYIHQDQFSKEASLEQMKIKMIAKRVISQQ